MTNDELEAVRARVEMHFQDGCYRSPRADYLCDIPALLDEVERLRAENTALKDEGRSADYALDEAHCEKARATRAEAHAERLASELERALPYVVNGHAHDGQRCVACEVESPIRQALSLYRSETTNQ